MTLRSGCCDSTSSRRIPGDRCGYGGRERAPHSANGGKISCDAVCDEQAVRAQSWLTQQIIALGIQRAVAVDFREARCLANSGVPLRHLGHLVQIPDGEIESALRCRPEVITVFSFDKAHRIAECARRLGIRQRLLLKVCQTGDIVYPGQEGGFQPNELLDVATRITALGGVKSPASRIFLCPRRRPRTVKTSPRRTLKRWSTRRKRCARRAFLSNRLTPRRPIAATPSLLARGGATHIEPGHAFTGTIPANECGEQPERIAMLYLSEVSHNAGPNSLCFGGGYYRRGRLRNALVFAGDALHETRTLPFKSDNIDYYRGWRAISRLAARSSCAFAHGSSSPAAT